MRLLADEDGQSAVEYALIAGALVLSLVGAATALKAAQTAAYQKQHEGLKKWRAP